MVQNDATQTFDLWSAKENLCMYTLVRTCITVNKEHHKWHNRNPGENNRGYSLQKRLTTSVALRDFVHVPHRTESLDYCCRIYQELVTTDKCPWRWVSPEWWCLSLPTCQATQPAQKSNVLHMYGLFKIQYIVIICVCTHILIHVHVPIWHIS